MRFERVVIRNFRAIREYRLELPADGVVVIEGENELGKSSIAEALWLIFEAPDSSDSDRVRSVKPVDRDAGSEIELTVVTGPYRFTYFKRYHRNQQTLLRIETPRREDRTGREAHDRVLQILDETTDRALWEALRMLQGDALAEVAVAGNLSIAAALDDAAVSALGSQREHSLFERAENEYLRYFTRTGRENKEFTNRRDEVARYQSEATRIDHQILELEGMADRAVELESRIAALHQQSASAEALLGELRERSRLRADALAALKDAAGALELAETRRAQLRQQADRREETLRECMAIEQRIAGADGPLSEARARLEVFEGVSAEAQASLMAARAELERVEAAVEVAQADYSHMHEQLQLQQMTDRLARVRAAQKSLRESVEFLNTCHTNPRIIAELEEAERTVAVESARLEAEGARVTLRAASPAEVTFDGQRLDLSGGTRELPVTGEVILQVGGVEVRISAGSAVAAIRERLERAAAGFSSRLQALGVADLQEARDLEARRVQAVSARQHYEERIRADLNDLASAEELEAKIERDRQRGVRYLATRNAIAPMPGSLQESRDRMTLARDAESAARNRLTPLEDAVRAAQNGAVAATDRVRSLEREREADQAQLERHREWLAAREEEQPIASLRTDLDQMESAVRAVEAAHAQAQEAAANIPDVAGELERAVGEADEFRKGLRAAEDELNRIAGALAHAGESGLNQRRDLALSQQQAAEAELDAFSQRAEAARLLFETLRRHREQAKRSYARPLEDRLNELGRTVFNSTFSVELDSDLRIARRTLDGTTLDYRHLSGGAREQLGILMRLACASLVSATGGVPLILDDVLGWSDPARVRRLGDVLATASEGVQVIILTCSPDRFASVVPGTIISLPSGRTRSTGPASEVVTPRTVPQTPSGARRSPAPAAPGRQAGFEFFDGEPASRN